jgi:hypothetical protein
MEGRYKVVVQPTEEQWGTNVHVRTPVKPLGRQKAPFPGPSRAGATGLEPATSGVTDHFEDREVKDDRCVIPLFLRLFGA